VFNIVKGTRREKVNAVPFNYSAQGIAESIISSFYCHYRQSPTRVHKQNRTKLVIV
jgi:hypothetical protein